MAKETILIVEDDAIISMRLQEMLNAWDYRTLTASSGEKALQEIGRVHTDLVLMDIRLDGQMDGIQAAEQIHSQPGPPTVFITAYSENELLERAKLTEPYGYLVKPIQERELRSMVEMVLFKYSLDQKLRESEEKFRTLAESTSTGILIYKGEDWVYANPAAEQITGYSNDELLKMHFWEIVHPEHRRLVQQWEAARALGEEAPRRYSFEILTKNGEERWLDISSERIKFQGMPAGVFTANDITERKMAERALRESREELQALARHLQTIREEERACIAQEIHDEFGQSLTAIKMELLWLAEQSSIVQFHDKLLSVIELTDTTIELVRKVASELRPGLLDDLGLEAALEWQAQEFSERAHIPCELHCETAGLELTRDVTTALFRIFQESLTNVARHACADSVRALLRHEDNWLVLTIADDGRGISDAALSNRKSMGLLGMRERARALGGDVMIYGQPNLGTTVEARIQLDKN